MDQQLKKDKENIAEILRHTVRVAEKYFEQQNTLAPGKFKFLVAIRDNGKVFFTPTNYKGIPAIRVAISNWQTEWRDMEIAYEVLTRVWEDILLSLNAEKIEKH